MSAFEQLSWGIYWVGEDVLKVRFLIFEKTVSMKLHFYFFFLLLILFSSCQATIEIETPEPTPDPPSSFMVTANQNPLSPLIYWNASTSTRPGMNIVYDVYYEGELVSEGQSGRSFSFNEMFSFTTHSGKVVARDELGQTTQANYTFTTTEKIYEGDLLLNGLYELNSFAAHKYDEINGYLFLKDIETTDGLETVKKIHGSELKLLNFTGDNLNGLENAEFTYSDLDLLFEDCPNLTDITGLHKLRHLRNVRMWSVNALENFYGLQLEWVENVNIQGMSSLTSLEELFKYSEPNDDLILKVESTDELENLDGLEAYTKMSILNCQGMSNVDGLSNLTEIGSMTLGCENVPYEGMSALQNLTTAQGLHISGNGNTTITDTNFLSSLEYCESFGVSGCPNYTNVKLPENLSYPSSDDYYELAFEGLGIESLDGLENLSMQKLTLALRYNSELTDYCAISDLALAIDPHLNLITWNNAWNPTVNTILGGQCAE